MMKIVSCRDLAELMGSDKLSAVFDVRERGEFNACQIAGATSLPRSQIEFRIAELVPNPRIALVVYDDGGGRAALAARTLGDLGYRNVAMLDGGLPAWEQQSLPAVGGVNVPSKAFGEKVHRERMIPDILPEELKRLQERSSDLIVFDVRTPEEYCRFCIPGGINVPGGDLILWVEELRRNPQRTVVVNCAGRTRSIIGAATLRRLGLENVRALKNGTMGWLLAGLELESTPTRVTPEPPDEGRRRAREIALRIAQEEKISLVAARELIDRSSRIDSGVIYLIDVRSESAYQGKHIPGSLNVPGGQAVQRADDFIAVRNGRIVFISDQSARAVMAAYWYRQMGFPNVQCLQGGLDAWRESGGPIVSGAARDEPSGIEAARRVASLLTPAEMNLLSPSSAVKVLHVGGSLDFEAAHLPGSQWISRGWLELKLPTWVTDLNQSIVLSCVDGQSSVLAARTLAEMGYLKVSVLAGGVRAWSSSGYPTVKGLDSCLVEANDVVLSPSIRGSKEDMERYLEWEMKLAR
jgi:rhodanese-related sulfurtransferase